MHPEKLSIRKLALCLVSASLIFTLILPPKNIAKAQTPSNPSATWTLEYDLSVPSDQAGLVSGSFQAQSQAESMLSSKQLQSQGITPKVTSGPNNETKVTMQGQGSVDQLRD